MRFPMKFPVELEVSVKLDSTEVVRLFEAAHCRGHRVRYTSSTVHRNYPCLECLKEGADAMLREAAVEVEP